NDAARTTRVLAIRGGLFEGKPIGEDEVRSLATLPPVDTLRAQLVGGLAGPLTTVVGLFTAPLRDLVGVLDARIRQLEAEGADQSTEAPKEGPHGGTTGSPVIEQEA